VAENICKSYKNSHKSTLAWHFWFTPVILATQEAEIRRIVVQSHLWQIVPETLSQKYPSQKKGWGSGSRRRPWVQASVTSAKKKKKTPLKNGQN
jgi:molybdopterin converting factor small subunit